jgi:hypothetical protein
VNAVVRLKPFLLEWMADVAARARARGKRLLAFSHYQALDTLGDSHADEVALFGETGVGRGGRRSRRRPARSRQPASESTSAGICTSMTRRSGVAAPAGW